MEADVRSCDTLLKMKDAFYSFDEYQGLLTVKFLPAISARKNTSRVMLISI